MEELVGKTTVDWKDGFRRIVEAKYPDKLGRLCVMTADDFVVDADGHLCEPAAAAVGGQPAGESLREHGIRLRWNEQTGYDECMVEDRMATDLPRSRGSRGMPVSRSTSSGAAVTTRISTRPGSIRTNG